MKIAILSLLLGWFTTQLAVSQVHLKGKTFFDVSLGMLDGVRSDPSIDNSGFWLSIGLGKYTKRENSWRWTATFLQKNYTLPDPVHRVGTLPVRHLSLALGHGFLLLASKQRFANVIVVPLIVSDYERVPSVTPGINYQINNPSKLLLGTGVGVELEIENLLILARQRWLPRSSTQQFMLQAGIGIRLNR